MKNPVQVEPQVATEQNARKIPVRIDDNQYHLESSKVKGAELLDLVAKPSCRYALVQVLRGADDQFIEPDEEVDVSSPGVEKFVTVLKDDVTIFIGDTSHVVRRGEHSVATILALDGKTPASHDLYQEKDGRIDPLPVNVPIQIEGCEQFCVQVQGGASS